MSSHTAARDGGAGRHLQPGGSEGGGPGTLLIRQPVPRPLDLRQLGAPVRRPPQQQVWHPACTPIEALTPRDNTLRWPWDCLEVCMSRTLKHLGASMMLLDTHNQWLAYL